MRSKKVSQSFSQQSSLKGTRWSFGAEMEKTTQFLYMPKETLKIKYTVNDLI
jgi:hypothetical protein